MECLESTFLPLSREPQSERARLPILGPAKSEERNDAALERENSLLRSVLTEARGGLGDCSHQIGAVLRAAATARASRDTCDREVTNPDPEDLYGKMLG